VLGSVAGVADEVVVMDTGSTDRTADVARERGANVFSHAWHDDFSAARNEVLDQASGDWVLWLNPDEELLPISKPAVNGYLSRADALAYVVRVQEIARGNQPERFTETVQLRLFRHHPELRFVGRLHPSFRTPAQELARREQKQVYPSEIVVRHHAYLSQVDESKLRWSARLLEQELRDRPGQLHYLIEYGRTLLWLNDPRGHEVLAEAAERLRPEQSAAAAPAASVGLLLEYLLTVSPAQARSRLSREEALALIMRWFPQSPPLLWRAAEYYFQKGDLRRAAGLLEQLLHYGRTGAYDRSAAFDPSIMGESALLNLGTCYRGLGDLGRAEHCFRLLLQSPSYRDQAGQQLAEVERLRQH
jgi:tetratricopeptide (TPR) repeat protein